MPTIQQLKEENKELRNKLAASRKHAEELQQWKREAEDTLVRLGKELEVLTQAKLNEVIAEQKRLEGRTIIQPGDPDFDPRKRVKIIDPNDKKR